jgi:hypothetical protein
VTVPTLTAEARAWLDLCGGRLHDGPADATYTENACVVDSWWVVDCRDCEGSGLFPLPDYTAWLPCVACKGTGDTLVTLARPAFRLTNR